MYFVYSIQSEVDSERYYVGITTDIQRRLKDHNSGKTIHTNKFKPWRIVSYTAFVNKSKAKRFEEYLKTSSGRAFSQKRL